MNRNIPLKKIIKSQGKKIKENVRTKKKYKTTRKWGNDNSTLYIPLSMDWHAWKKDMEWLIGFKNSRIHLNAAYKKLTSELETHTDWKWGVGKSYLM